MFKTTLNMTSFNQKIAVAFARIIFLFLKGKYIIKLKPCLFFMIPVENLNLCFRNRPAGLNEPNDTK